MRFALKAEPVKTAHFKGYYLSLIFNFQLFNFQLFNFQRASRYDFCNRQHNNLCFKLELGRVKNYANG